MFCLRLVLDLHKCCKEYGESAHLNTQFLLLLTSNSNSVHLSQLINSIMRHYGLKSILYSGFLSLHIMSLVAPGPHPGQHMTFGQEESPQTPLGYDSFPDFPYF